MHHSIVLNCLQKYFFQLKMSFLSIENVISFIHLMNKFMELIKSQTPAPLILEWNTIEKIQKLEEGGYGQIW